MHRNGLPRNLRRRRGRRRQLSTSTEMNPTTRPDSTSSGSRSHRRLPYPPPPPAPPPTATTTPLTPGLAEKDSLQSPRLLPGFRQRTLTTPSRPSSSAHRLSHPCQPLQSRTQPLPEPPFPGHASPRQSFRTQNLLRHACGGFWRATWGRNRNSGRPFQPPPPTALTSNASSIKRKSSSVNEWGPHIPSTGSSRTLGTIPTSSSTSSWTNSTLSCPSSTRTTAAASSPVGHPSTQSAS